MNVKKENETLIDMFPEKSDFSESNDFVKELNIESKSIEKNDYTDYQTLLSEQADILVAKFYNKPGLPRCIVDAVIEGITTFLSSGVVDKLKSKVFNTLKDLNAEESEVSDIKKMFENLTSSFSNLKTEYLREKHFQKSGFFIPPLSYTIDIRPERKVSNDSIKIEMKNITGQHLPLRQILKKFFELPDALTSTFNYMRQLEFETDSISNVIQCAKWKMIRKSYQPEDIVIPLLVYYDDWEPNNPLGPHCEKIGSVYIDLPCLPPECHSKLENIFESLLFNADDRKTYNNQKTFQPLNEDLKFLEKNGIIVETEDGPKTIYFATVLLKGDNLGLNGMCGYVECFVANFPCRICRATKKLTESMCRENPHLLRNDQNYIQDLNKKNYSLTGIKEEFIFKDIKSLYCGGIGSISSTDEMHDLAEGVAHYTMIPVLKHYSTKNRLFLDILNSRMYMIHYGQESGGNQPPSITEENLSKNKFKMTAAEMLFFVKYFGLFVGDLTSEEDEFWQLYLLLHDIMDIVRAKTLPSDIVKTLDYLVEEHHILYMKLTKEKLKPKHHFLLHYGRIFQLFRPLANISCIRDEARHKILKAYTNVCMSRKNLIKSLAIKRMFALCLRFLVKESILPKTIMGPGEIADFSSTNNYCCDLPVDISDKTEYFCPKWVDYKGTKYVLGMVLILGVDESRSLCFGEILCIIPKEHNVFFICLPLLNLGLNAHIRGFEVERIENSNYSQGLCVNADSLIHPFPLTIHSVANGEKYVVPKYYL